MSADLRRLAAVAALPLAFGACSWFTDFKDQPRIEPWEAEYQGELTPFRGNPQHSVSIYGENAVGYDISRPRYPMVMPMVIDSFAAIPNPTPISAASLENGRKYYEINCAVCHGPAGAGDGPALRYGVAAPSLLTDRAKGLSDGYYWGIIRNGRVSMPSYDRIESMDRWDVVNYIRGLQGSIGQTVPTGPLGKPGETGKTVPGASMTGPTRPAPYENPRSSTAVETRLLLDSLLRTSTPAPRAAADTAAPARPGAPAPAADTTRRAVPQGGRP